MKKEEAMFTEERQSAIEKCLRENGKVKVKELSEMFQVTEDCIRKDLKILENAGKLKRTYGGAILSQDYPLKRDVVDRRQFNLDKKRTIAAKAFKLIKNNETIFLDISTTNIELAKLLATSNMRVVVVSNMIDILQILEVRHVGEEFVRFREIFVGIVEVAEYDVAPKDEFVERFGVPVQ